jgi:hypothetical protein
MLCLDINLVLIYGGILLSDMPKYRLQDVISASLTSSGLIEIAESPGAHRSAIKAARR